MDAPTGIRVDPLNAVNRRTPITPTQLGLRRIRMRRNPEPAEPPHIVDHIAWFPGERVRRRRHVECDVVSARCADLDGIQTEDAGAVHRGVGYARRIAVIGEDNEPGAGTCRYGG